MDRRRLADVRVGTADQQRSGGSGYLVGQRLVLTCRHVVADDQERLWPRLEVWLGHPGDGPRRRAGAEVVWVHPDRDAALLRIEGEPFPGGSLVRWGWFTGPDPAPYTGMGYPEFTDYESGRGVEQLGGMLPPLGMGADGAYVLNQGSAPETAAGRAWPGVSGAAVFCQGLLTAVVIKDDRAFGNRRLHAVPVSTLTAEPGFARLVTEDIGTAPTLEAVELAEFLQPPATQILARTPGSLLAAAVEAVEFTGREGELAELAAWRDSGEGFAVMLVTGEGGQGKTRLARHFAALAREARWAGGFLAARAATPASGEGGGKLQSTVELARRVREASRPVLLIADYAETRPDDIAALVDVLDSSPPAHPARILLLSRTAGAWWANLTEALGPHITHRMSLDPLTGADQTRHDAYAAAVTGLARHLAALPDPLAERVSGQSWSTLAEQLATNPPELDDPRLGNALSLQITALTDLLAAAAGQAPVGGFGERELVGHERGYLRRAAARRRLFSPCMLSDRADDDERAAEAWTALERALAGLILLGPCDANQAQAIGGLASGDRPGEVVNWLAALYPPPGEEFSLGAVQPDRLAELLLGPVLIQETGLLGQVGALTASMDGAFTVLFTLARTAAHPAFVSISEQAADLIASRPDPFAVAAPVLAATLPQPGPLQDGLLRLGQHNPRGFQQTAFTALNQLPDISVSGALFSVALTTVMMGILRPLAETDPGVYRPYLADYLNNLGARLAYAGQRQAALAPAQEAADTYRQLAATNPDAHLPYLAAALNNLGNRLGEAGQRQAALAPAQEAADTYRQLAATNPDAHLPGLAMALNNLGARLGEAGQRQAALAPAQEAADTYRQLAATNPDAHLPGLAMALNNLGARLGEAGQRQAALAPAQEAVTIRRQLATANPDAYVPDLATALNNLGARLGEAGQPQAALASVRETAEIYRQLAMTNPDAYLPHLANALDNLGNRLADAGQPQAALAPAQEAADTYRQLIAVNPDAHLPYLAGALNNLGARLGEAGQRQAALAPAQEAADTYRQLATANPDAYLPDLASALNNLGNRLAEAGQPQAALAPAQEAVTIRRRLIAANPDAYLPDLASALNDLGSRLGDTGQRQAALAPAQEAADTYRQLIAANAEAHLPGLASALNNLGIRLADAGQRDAALAAAQEAADTYRQLATAEPGAYLPDLATALTNLGNRLAEAGQPQAALAPAQEAADTCRQLATTNHGAYLPDLANALNNLGNHLAVAGQRPTALAAAQEAADTYRQLAAADPCAYLPGLAMALNNLGMWLAEAGQREAALAPAQEAVTIRRQLAAANPDAYLPYLANALNNLGHRLAEVGREDEAHQIWESAITDLPEESWRLALTVAYAGCLLGQPDRDAGVDLLVRILTVAEVPGPVEADARQLLREHWRQHPRAVEQAWQSASTAPLPGWMYLTDDQIGTVISWINTGNWAESRSYFYDHAGQLLADQTITALDELALTASENLISQHSGLLDAARQHELDAAYQRLLLLADILGEWIAAPDWDASCTFLKDHPELLDKDVPGILANLSKEPDPAITVHQALLALAHAPAGVDGAYQSLQDEQSLRATASAAIANRDAALIEACAVLETFALDRAFTGALHMILAWLMTGPAGQLPEGWAAPLRTLATQADPAEKDTALAQFDTALVSISADSTVASQLRHVLGQSGRQ